MLRRLRAALLAALAAALAARGQAAVTTSSSETSDATAGAAGGAVCGVNAPACALAVSSVADPTLAGVYDVTVRARATPAPRRVRAAPRAPRRSVPRGGRATSHVERTQAPLVVTAPARAPGAAAPAQPRRCGARAAAASPPRCVGASRAVQLQGCRQGRPLYTRRQASQADPPRVLAWAGNASASSSVWIAAAAVSASGASGVVLRSNAPRLLGGFQARAAWARPEWLTPEPGHAAWLTAAGAEAPDVAVACAAPAAADTATTLVAATSASGCTLAERGACELVITASTDDPLVTLSGLYPLAGCVGGRPLYTRAATTITPQMHIAFLVRAGGVWAVTSSVTAAPAAVLLPNPSVWSAATPAASRPESVAVSYSSYAHDAWVWSAWPVAGGVLNTSVASLGRLPALPSPSFTLLCSSSDYVRSPPPSAPPAAPGSAGGDDQLSSPGALGGLIAALIFAALLGTLAAALLIRRQRAKDMGDDATSSGSGEGGDPGSPWFAALHTRADQVVLGKELGHGGYATVHAATWRCSPVAAKVLHPSVQQASASLNAALAKEVLLMSRIRHPNVLSVFGFCLRPPMLLLELGTRGSLAALLRSDASPALGWRERCRLAHGVACGLAFLHAPEPPIVHLDVKCENVVLDDGLCPKVSDFGLSALLLQIAPPDATGDEGSESADANGNATPGSAQPYRPLRARGVGTPLFMPPELDSREPLQLPLAVDAFCFGSAVLHALAHHGTTAQVGEFTSPVYRHYHRQLTQPGGPSAAATLSVAGPTSLASGGGWNVMQTLLARESMGWMPEIAPRCPPPLADAIRKCCVVDPAARPRMDALRDEMQALMQQADGW